jgi:eukaryotic-like serine/threonine-protein kinase
VSSLLDELRAGLPERYQVEAEVGRGGMATVFVAEDLKHGRRVAIKVLTPELSSSVGADRFLREIQVSARLSHPHILPVFDSGEANGLLYYVMPFVEGESLRGRVRREQQLAITDAITITCEVADALAYAHGMGIVHRDIKPENVLLHGGHAVVADFGIAHMLYEADGGKLTQTGMSLGTAAYMSPEQFAGHSVDGRSDQYSLACMLYELLVGEVPFTGPNPLAVMARHTMEAVPSIRVVRQTVPDELEGVIMRALEKVPADRYATIHQFKEALLGGAAGTTFAPRTTRYAVPRMTVQERMSGGWRNTSTRARFAIISAILLLVVGGGISARLFLEHAPKAPLGGPDLKHIAVTYFEDRSPDGQLAYLADGLTESLIDALTNVPSLRVVSRNGVRPFRGHDAPADSIGRALNAGSVVTGFVQPTSRGVRVQVQLVDGGSGVEYDRKKFEFPAANVSAAKDSLTRLVSDFLRERLGTAIELSETRQQSKNPRAWTLYQRAEKRSKDADSLLALDSAKAGLATLDEADSMLVNAEREDALWSAPPTLRANVAYRRARALRKDPTGAAAAIDSGMMQATRAIADDSRNPDAYEIRGSLHFLRYQMKLTRTEDDSRAQIDSAEQDFLRAVDINPQQATAHAALTRLYYAPLRRNIPKALLEAQLAYQADAFLKDADYILSRLFWTNYDNQSFPEANRWCSEGTARFPRDRFFVECHLWMMTTPNGDNGQTDPAHAWELYGRFKSLVSPRDTAFELRKAQVIVGGALARAHLPDSARHVLVRARAPQGVDPENELIGREAVMRVILGDQDEAVQLLTRYFTTNPDHLKGFAAGTGSWWWRDLQSNPKFKALVSGAR